MSQYSSNPENLAKFVEACRQDEKVYLKGLHPEVVEYHTKLKQEQHNEANAIAEYLKQEQERMDAEFERDQLGFQLVPIDENHQTKKTKK